MKPVFIISLPRSGTTLLRAMLYPRIAIPPENFALQNMMYTWRRFWWLPYPVRKRLTLRRFKEAESTRFWNISLEELKPKKKNIGSLITTLYLRWRDKYAQHAERWGDKTPRMAQHLPVLYSVFPDADYLQITRNSRDAIASYLTSFDRPIHDVIQRYISDEATIESFGQQHASQFMQISYEELTRRPQQTIEEVCRFLGVTFDEGMLHPYEYTDVLGDTNQSQHRLLHQEITPSRIGSWRERLNDEQREILLSYYPDDSSI
jgi:hypothetical protein